MIKSNRLLVGLLLCYSQVGGVAAHSLAVGRYSCDRYAGAMQFTALKKANGATENFLFRGMGKEYYEAVAGVATHTAAANSHLRDCSSREFYCVAEEVASDNTVDQGFVYSVPRVIRAPQKYSIEGREFAVSLYMEFSPKGDGAAEVWSTDLKGNRYKYVVVGGKGIVSVHYSLLYAQELSDLGVAEYTNVDCRVVDGVGVFAGIKVFGPLGERGKKAGAKAKIGN